MINMVARAAAAILAVSLAWLGGCSEAETTPGLDEQYPEDTLLLSIRTVDSVSVLNAVEGEAPLTVYVRPSLSNSLHSGEYRDVVSKLEIDFGDGAVEDGTAALFAFADYYDEYGSTALPLEQWAAHTYTTPGVYELSGAVTWTDGTTTLSYNESFYIPPTITITAAETETE